MIAAPLSGQARNEPDGMKKKYRAAQMPAPAA